MNLIKNQKSKIKNASVALTLLLLPLLSGCVLFGIAARAIPKIVPAAYPGLKGKSVAIMVWADRAIAIDWPSMPIDVTASLQKKLLVAQKTDDPDALKGTTFPVTPQSMARFQMDHPESQLMPITQVAPQVGVQRLIYIEIVNFQTRPDLSVDTELFYGQLSANVKIVELENGKAKVAPEEFKIAVTWPKNAPKDGVLNIGDAKTYVGTVDSFTSVLALRFFKHEEEYEVGD